MRSAAMNRAAGRLMSGAAIRAIAAGGAPMRGLVPGSVRAEVPTDVKTAIEAVNKAVAEFRTANDERIEALNKGKADIVTEQKVDRANAAVDKAVADLDKVKADVAKIMAHAEELAGKVARMKLAGGEGGGKTPAIDVRTAAARFFAGKAAQAKVTLTDDQVEQYKAFGAAFKEYLGRPLDALPVDVRAALQVGSDPDGGYWVPTEMSMDIKRRIFETSPMRQISSVLAIGTDSIKFPTAFNDWTLGGWVGETEARSESATPQVGEIEIFVREQYAEPRVTQKLLDMAEIDVEGYISQGIADKMARAENTAFVSGVGVNQPRGFLDYKTGAVTTNDDTRAASALQYVVTGASAGFPAVSGIPGAADADALITIVNELNPAYLAGARWVMSRRTLAAIRKLKDGNGRYLVGSMRDIESSFAGFDIGGFPVTMAEDMPAIAADSFSVSFGNFAVGYQIVDGRGIRVLRDNLTTKPYVKFYTTKWTGGDVVNFYAIKLLKFGTS